MLTFGRELRLPLDRALEPANEEFASRIQKQTELISKLHSIYNQARTSIERSQASQARYYNKRHKRIQFNIGDKVLVRSHFLSNKSVKFCKKFAYRWLGPFQVTKVVSPVTYELCDPTTMETKGNQNVKNLKPFFDRPSLVSFSSNVQSVSNSSNVQSSSQAYSTNSSDETSRTHYNLRSKSKT